MTPATRATSSVAAIWALASGPWAAAGRMGLHLTGRAGHVGRITLRARAAFFTRSGSHLSSGQGLVEYGLILSLAALVTVIALVFFGGAIAAALSLLGDAIDSSR